LLRFLVVRARHTSGFRNPGGGSRFRDYLREPKSLSSARKMLIASR
jgi:hypothetical protein